MAAAPKARILVRHHSGRGSSFWRVMPAALVSAIFHVGILFALILLSGISEARPELEREKKKEAEKKEAEKEEKESVKSEVPHKPAEANDPFVTTDIDPNRQEFDTDFSEKKDDPMEQEADRQAQIAVAGLVDPNEAVGTITGSKDAIPVSVAPQLGLGGGFGGGIGDGPPAIGIGTIGTPGIGPAIGSGGTPKGVALGGSIFGRSGAIKEQMLREGGGTGESEAAVARGLRWLVMNQAADGSWPGCANDIAGTAFGLLPLLGAGHTHKPAPKNPYDKPILKGLQFLIAKQDKKGNFGGGMYAQGLATIAMCEAYGLSQDPMLRRPAQLAVDYIVWAQHDAGGWRYGPKQAGDTSVVGWQVMALKSAQMSGLDVPEATMRKAINYLESVCANEGYGYAGPGASPTMSAVGLLCRQYLQAWGARNKRMFDGVHKHILTHKPAVNNMYYTYYATQVLHHFGGREWKEWNEKTRESLIASQDKTNGPNGGSWDPSRGGHMSGRIMMTSLCLLTLEVYYRHLPLYYRDAGEKR